MCSLERPYFTSLKHATLTLSFSMVVSAIFNVVAILAEERVALTIKRPPHAGDRHIHTGLIELTQYSGS